MKIKSFLFIAVGVFFGAQAFAQSNNGTLINGQALSPNVITTAVPFISIAPDARGGSLGDCGVASEADVYSMHYNPAKYTFMDPKMSIGLGYSPWLHNLVPDMSLAYLAYAAKLTPRSAIASTLRYFSCGNITFVDANNQNPMEYKPNEWALDVAYSRMLTEYLSGSVAGRFIYSNLTGNYAENTSAGWSVAADVAVYYKRPVEWFREKDAEFAWGLNINNIGSKVSYNNASIGKDFIPTTMRLGTSLKVDLNEHHSMAFMVDVTKLLVPTPPVTRNDTLYGKSNDVSVMEGIFQSFWDAPGIDANGVGRGRAWEELCEYNFGLGIEYWYSNVFALRAGYFNEPALKGNRKYVTMGAAVKFVSFGLDVSYLVPVNGTPGTNPLENTLRINLSYDIVSGEKSNLPETNE